MIGNAELHPREKLRIEIPGIIVFNGQRFMKVVHEKKKKKQCEKGATFQENKSIRSTQVNFTAVT